MKKFILSALLPLLYFLYSLFPLVLPVTATAESEESVPVAGGYACILTDSAFFYSARDEKRGLFLLPKTYYVKVLEAAPDYCKIEYLYDDSYVKKLTGYARTSDLTFVDYTPKRPYLYYLLEVNYRIDETLEGGDGFLNEITITCAYYGDYRIGSETYCYVLRGDSFGYIPKPEGISYDENEEYAEYLSSKTPEEATPQDPVSSEKNSSSPAQIAILVALCLLVPVLAALILKPPRRPPYETDEQ